MNTRTKIVIIFTLLFNSLTYSQSANLKRTYHWYFGEKCGIDFSSGTAIADTNGVLNTLEGCASISDTNGNLLFYTDGINVWDSTHSQMSNGFGLHGDWSSFNSAAIVPKPNSDHLYYIFTTPAYAGHWTGNTAFEYSIVDMSLNGGLGDLVTKNIVLFSTAIEQLGVVQHKNKQDYWVVAHEAFSNNFKAYLVSSSGVSSTPVVSSIGFSNGGYTPDCWGCACSYLKFSQSGCKMVCTYPNNDTFEIFDFDNNSGTVLNPLTVNIFYPVAASFSPNNNLLYLGSYVNDSIFEEKIYQFDLSSNSEAGILSSKVTISSNIGMMTTMQIAPDGKMYCTKYQDNYLAVINNPNNYGVSCNFVENGFYLGGRLSLTGLPNFVQSYFVNDTIEYYCSSAGISEILDNNSFSIYPTPFSNQLTFDNTNSEQISVSLFNFSGEQILQETFTNTTTIKTEGLSSGIYFYQLRDVNGFVMSGKVIKD